MEAPTRYADIVPDRLFFAQTISALFCIADVGKECGKHRPLPALHFGSNLTNATGCVRYCNAVMSMICVR